jgi:Domain of unknown function (DUF4382)
MRIRHIAVSLSLLMAIACGNDDNPTGSSGNFMVRITDTPFSDARAVFVTFSDVSIHRSGSDFERVPFSPASDTRTCDLKRLTAGAIDTLGTGSLPEGHYTEIRVTVTRATIYWDEAGSGPACAASLAAPGGRSSMVEVPSGELKLNRQFELTSGATVTITLDFDGDRSIHQTGNGTFMMNPVMAIVSLQ